MFIFTRRTSAYIESVGNAVSTFALLLIFGLASAPSLAQSGSLVWKSESIRLNASGTEMLQLERSTLSLTNQGSKGNATIALPLVRLKASSETEVSQAPVLFVPGGPGLSGIQHLRIVEFRNLFVALSKQRDVYLYDPRGTGEATPSLMPSRDRPLIARNSLATREDFLAQMHSLSADVIRRLDQAGLSSSDFGFLQAVQDIERIRKELSIEKLDLVAHSFGTQVAVEYAQRFPKHVGRLTLISLRPVENAYKSPAENDAFLTKILTLAAKEPTVAEKLPDPLGSLKSVISKLDQQPVSVAVKTARGDETFDVGGYALRFMITAFFMNDPENIAHLPKLIHELESGSRPWGLVFNLGRILQGGVAFTWFTNELSVAQNPAQAERHARESSTSILQQSMNFPIPEVGASWKITPAAFSTDFSKLRDISILIVSGTLDGVTPTEHAVAFAAKLPKARLLRVTNGGHQSSLRSADVERAIVDFHSNRTLPTELAVAPVRFISLTPPYRDATKK